MYKVRLSRIVYILCAVCLFKQVLITCRNNIWKKPGKKLRVWYIEGMGKRRLGIPCWLELVIKWLNAAQVIESNGLIKNADLSLGSLLRESSILEKKIVYSPHFVQIVNSWSAEYVTGGSISRDTEYWNYAFTQAASRFARLNIEREELAPKDIDGRNSPFLQGTYYADRNRNNSLFEIPAIPTTTFRTESYLL